MRINSAQLDFFDGPTTAFGSATLPPTPDTTPRPPNSEQQGRWYEGLASPAFHLSAAPQRLIATERLDQVSEFKDGDLRPNSVLVNMLGGITNLAADIGGIVHTECWEAAAEHLLIHAKRGRDAAALTAFTYSTLRGTVAEFAHINGDSASLAKECYRLAASRLRERREFSEIDAATVESAFIDSARVNHPMIDLLLRAQDCGIKILLFNDSTKFLLPAALSRLSYAGLSVPNDNIVSSVTVGKTKERGLFEELGQRVDPLRTIVIDDIYDHCLTAHSSRFHSYQPEEYVPAEFCSPAAVRRLELGMLAAWEKPRGFGRAVQKHIRIF